MPIGSSIASPPRGPTFGVMVQSRVVGGLGVHEEHPPSGLRPRLKRPPGGAWGSSRSVTSSTGMKRSPGSRTRHCVASSEQAQDMGAGVGNQDEAPSTPTAGRSWTHSGGSSPGPGHSGERLAGVGSPPRWAGAGESMQRPALAPTSPFAWVARPAASHERHADPVIAQASTPHRVPMFDFAHPFPLPKGRVVASWRTPMLACMGHPPRLSHRLSEGDGGSPTPPTMPT